MASTAGPRSLLLCQPNLPLANAKKLLRRPKVSEIQEDPTVPRVVHGVNHEDRRGEAQVALRLVSLLLQHPENA